MLLPDNYSGSPDDDYCNEEFGEHIHVYKLDGDPATHIAHAQVANYWCDQVIVNDFRDTVAKASPRRQLGPNQVMLIAPAVPLGFHGSRGPFSLPSLKVEDIDGRRVLALEFDYHQTGLRRYMIIANPTETADHLDCVWFECRADNFAELSEPAIKALHSIEWIKH